MTEQKKEFIQKYIDELKYNISDYSDVDISEMYSSIRKVIGIFSKDYPYLESSLRFGNDSAYVDTEILIGLLEKEIIEEASESEDLIIPNSIKEKPEEKCSSNTEPIIFLSHCSKDKKYGDALESFITSLGVKSSQLIYTSHPLHKIPLGVNIYDYLRKNINTNVFMIILWSNDYLESPACLNEMGAAWVVQSDYTNIYVPDFEFGNKKYHECAVDTKKMGAVLKNDQHCKTAMIELKNKIQELFSLENDEVKVNYILDEFMKKISEEA